MDAITICYSLSKKSQYECQFLFAKSGVLDVPKLVIKHTCIQICIESHLTDALHTYNSS
jgi:hypothetical protein